MKVEFNFSLELIKNDYECLDTDKCLDTDIYCDEDIDIDFD